MAGQIEVLQSGQEALRRQLETLSKQNDALREQASHPAGNYASQEDLKRVADAVKEVDRKRVEDAEKIHNELVKLQKTLQMPLSASKPKSAAIPAVEPTSEKSSVPDNGYEYVVKKGDTLSIIVQAYRDKNIKISLDQILKANPGLKPEKLRVGQKLFIPAPES